MEGNIHKKMRTDTFESKIKKILENLIIQKQINTCEMYYSSKSKKRQ